MPSSTSLTPRRWPARTVGDVDFPAVHTDAPAGGDQDVAIVERVCDVRQSVVWLAGGLVDVDGAFHVERLLWPLVIERMDEIVEPRLLLEDVGAGRLGGLALQGEMHAFMAAIPLRMAGLDALDSDAEAQPPDGEA